MILIDSVFIDSRNRRLLKVLLDELDIKYAIDNLITDFNTIYVHQDDKLKRLRLMGVEKIHREEEHEENGVISNIRVPTKEIKRVQLYVMKRRQFESSDEDDLSFYKKKLSFVVDLIKELSLFHEIELLEKKNVSSMFWSLSGV
jgi:hypothetical protein